MRTHLLPSLRMPPATLRIRTLAPTAREDVNLVARRMGETLDEVLGSDRQTERYSQEWLERRVLQHLDASQLTGEVYLAVQGDVVAGHTIVRIDEDERHEPIGLFATIYVSPIHRRQGVADALLARGEDWMRSKGMTSAVTYTDEHNTKLHTLFARRGYAMSPMPKNFVALTKVLTLTT